MVRGRDQASRARSVHVYLPSQVSAAKVFGPLAAAFLFASPAVAQPLVPLPSQPEGLAWPTEGWEEGEMPAETAALVRPLIDRAMAGERDEVMGVTRAIVIVHRGKVVAEAYREGFGPETKQISWSMAKSITSALVGRAMQQGLIDNLDAPMPSPFDADDPRAAITWRQWMTMTDGLDYLEIGATGLMNNDVVQMMYGRGRFDVLQYIKDELPPAHEPGAVWNYSTVAFHLIGRAVQTSLGLTGRCSTAASEVSQARAATPVTRCTPTDGPMADWMNTALFVPLGMDAQPEFDTAGTYLGGSLVWASARDFAKFGYLYLRDGVWEGEYLLPEGWVDFARTDPPGTEATVYGAGFWLSPEHPVPAEQGIGKPPFDAFSAQGHEGQTIWIVPSRDLVIVRLGLMGEAGGDWPALFEWNQEIARAFPDVTSGAGAD